MQVVWSRIDSASTAAKRITLKLKEQFELKMSGQKNKSRGMMIFLEVLNIFFFSGQRSFSVPHPFSFVLPHPPALSSWGSETTRNSRRGPQAPARGSSSEERSLGFLLKQPPGKALPEIIQLYTKQPQRKVLLSVSS